MEILELHPAAPLKWKGGKKRHKMSPMKRLEKIVATENDELHRSIRKPFAFFCEDPSIEDFAFFRKMLGSPYSCFHIAFRSTDDWSEKDEAFTLTYPDVCMTHVGAWIVWMCYYATEAAFAKELKASTVEDYEFEPLASR